MRAKLWVVAVAGVMAGGGAVWLAAHQSVNRPTEPGRVLALVVGASLLGSGLASWRARPENRLGPVMVLTAFAWFAGELSEARRRRGCTRSERLFSTRSRSALSTCCCRSRPGGCAAGSTGG
jgi:hypothetical protein